MNLPECPHWPAGPPDPTDVPSGGERDLPSCFTETERAVIQLAQADRLGTLRHAGAITRLVRALVGGEGDNELADPRLETLRRLAVILHAKALHRACDEIDAALTAGFTTAQIASLADYFEA